MFKTQDQPALRFHQPKVHTAEYIYLSIPEDRNQHVSLTGNILVMFACSWSYSSPDLIKQWLQA